MTDLFQLQDDLATAIVNALQVQLGEALHAVPAIPVRVRVK